MRKYVEKWIVLKKGLLLIASLALLTGCSDPGISVKMPDQALPIHSEQLFEELNSSSDQSVSEETFKYFSEIAFGSEYGHSTNTIKKWTGEIRLKIHGNPSNADLLTIQTVISELNTLLPESSQITLSSAAPSNANIYFIKKDEFSAILPNSPRNANGVVAIWSRQNQIQKSTILIASSLSQEKRDHVIREELTQSLGLLKDSYRYSNSIFYNGPSLSTDFSSIDEAVIALLYHPKIYPGLSLSPI